MGTRFGETPVVSSHLKATHNGEIIYESESECKVWCDRAPTGDNEVSRVEDNSMADGYQYVTIE
jgi:hypothetical protein